MKAEMVSSTQGFLKTHRLLDLADDCATRNTLFDDQALRETLAIFDGFAEVGRYGGMSGKNQADVQADPGIEVVGAMLWERRYVDLLDHFTFNVRRLLDFRSANFRDQIAAIVDDDKGAMLIAQWSGQPSIREVLLHRNRYFGVQPASADKSNQTKNQR